MEHIVAAVTDTDFDHPVSTPPNHSRASEPHQCPKGVDCSAGSSAFAMTNTCVPQLG
jgi:hypothetical protein